MEEIKKARIISILKLVLYSFIAMLWCFSTSRLENLLFIALMSILIFINAIKIFFSVKEVKRCFRVIVLVTIWIIETMIATVLWTLLFYRVGFDVNDILAFIIIFFILVLFIVEITEFFRFLKTVISDE